MSLAQRSVQSATWATFATVAALPINFIHSVLLARWLPIEYFGIYAAVYSIIILSGSVFEFGFSNAFIHRSEETEDETRAAAAYFTLRLIFDTAWAVILIAAGWLFFERHAPFCAGCARADPTYKPSNSHTSDHARPAGEAPPPGSDRPDGGFSFCCDCPLGRLYLPLHLGAAALTHDHNTRFFGGDVSLATLLEARLYCGKERSGRISFVLAARTCSTMCWMLPSTTWTTCGRASIWGMFCSVSIRVPINLRSTRA